MSSSFDSPPVRMLSSDGAWPSFSPDGGSLAFGGGLRSGDRRILVVPVHGNSAARPVTPSGFDATRPSWSWQESTIVFNHQSARLFTIDPESGAVQPIGVADATPKLAHPSRYKDLKSIAVVGFKEGPNGREGVIYKVTPGDEVFAEVEPLTSYPHVCAGRPSVSPDGKSVVFAGNAGGFDQARNQLWLVTPPRAARRLEPGTPASAYHGRSPSWSPDGKWIAFVSARPAAEIAKETPKAVWVIPSAGGEARQLTDTRYDPGQVAWSGDQTRIAFGSFRHGIGIFDVPEEYRP